MSGNAELLRSALEAARSGDFGPAESLLDPGVQWHAADPAIPPCRSREDVLRVWRGWQGSMPEVRRLEERGNDVAVESEADGERFVTSFTLRDGRIVHMQDHRSFEEAAAGLGAEI